MEKRGTELEKSKRVYESFLEKVRNETDNYHAKLQKVRESSAEVEEKLLSYEEKMNRCINTSYNTDSGDTCMEEKKACVRNCFGIFQEGQKFWNEGERRQTSNASDESNSEKVREDCRVYLKEGREGKRAKKEKAGRVH